MKVGKIWPSDFWFLGSRYFFFCHGGHLSRAGDLLGKIFKENHQKPS